MTAAPPFLGVVECSGYVIDSTLVGDDVARRRVIDRWQDGDRLHRLVDGRWLLLLGEPELTRCETAIGLPLAVTESGGLAPAGSSRAPSAGVVDIPTGGTWDTAAIAGLAVLDPAEWLVAGLEPATLLTPLEPRLVASVAADHSAPEEVDLRAGSKVGAPDAAVADAVARLRATSVDAFGAGMGGRGGRASAGAPGGGPAGTRWWDAAVDRVLDSPLGAIFSSGHRRYLERLGKAFAAKDFDEALRNAIALGGDELARTTLRLPPPRGEFSGPSLTATQGGLATRFPMSVQAYLASLYRDAALALEKDGRIEEAAFVLADLLKDVKAAIALLERHGRLDLAASLADGRSDDPVEAVRLLWKAGRRHRALDVARARGAFAAAIQRLGKDDVETAQELRAAWAGALRDSGDYPGAVEVLWVDPALRLDATADVEAGLVLGGAVRAHLIPYALAVGPRPELAEEALSLARGGDPDAPHSAREFVRSLAEHRAHDGVLDRRLTSEVLRTLVDIRRSPVRDDRLGRRFTATLAGRADPVLRADRAKLPQPPTPARGAGVVVLTARSGTLPVRDAVPLDNGDVVVASGSFGLRLVSSTGRVRAHWDVPSEHISVVDHGGGLVVAASAGTDTWRTHRLDLATRRIRPWVTVRGDRFLETFDGLTLGMVETEGTVGFLDTSAAAARVVWRELRETGRAVDVARSSDSMAAVVALAEPPPGHSGLELWWWSLPGMTLRGRRQVPWPERLAAVTADGTYWRLGSDTATGSASPSAQVLDWVSKHDRPQRRLLPDGQVTLRACGSGFALLHPGAESGGNDLSVELRTGPWEEPDLTVEVPGATGAGVRMDRGLACVWDPAGRIVVADLADRHVLGNFALTI